MTILTDLSSELRFEPSKPKIMALYEKRSFVGLKTLYTSKFLLKSHETYNSSNSGKLCYSDVSIKNIDFLPNRQYIANTADSAQERYS